LKPSEALLDFGKPVAFYPGLVKRLGSVNAVLFFCQILYYTGKERHPELGIYKTAAEIEQETGLTVKEQQTARKRLRAIGVLIETEKRLEHRIYYRLDLDKFNDLKALPTGEDPDEQSVHSRMANGTFGDRPLGHSGIAPRDIRIAESTSESTYTTPAYAPPQGGVGDRTQELAEINAIRSRNKPKPLPPYTMQEWIQIQASLPSTPSHGIRQTPPARNKQRPKRYESASGGKRHRLAN
jgi:hypothetical protein